jgi:hypothetical protein
MTFMRICAIAIVFGLSACTMSEPPSRGQTDTQALLLGEAGFAVKQVNILVPRTLYVSEENTYLPKADIVWHGDPEGDRYAQVQRIFDRAMQQGTQSMRNGPPVVLDIVVTRFHALTNKTRASIGGKHDLFYELTMRDAKTGAILLPTRRVNATVRGAGGAQALAEEAIGRTQKVVITEALIASIQKELTVKGKSVGGLVSQSMRQPALDLPN